MEFYVIPVTMNTNANGFHILQGVISLIYFTYNSTISCDVYGENITFFSFVLAFYAGFRVFAENPCSFIANNAGRVDLKCNLWINQYQWIILLYLCYVSILLELLKFPINQCLLPNVQCWPYFYQYLVLLFTQVLHCEKMLVIRSVIHRNKTIKFNSKHDNAIKDSQNNILCTIGYYSAIVIDISLRATLWTRIWRKSYVHIVGHGTLSEKSWLVENAKTNACLRESCNTSSKSCNGWCSNFVGFTVLIWTAQRYHLGDQITYGSIVIQ
jgi:hypothetical protein